MPSFTQACFVALAASWSFRELSPDLVQCIPLAWAGYESFSEACSHQPSAPEPADSAAPPPPSPRPPSSSRSRKRASQRSSRSPAPAAKEPAAPPSAQQESAPVFENVLPFVHAYAPHAGGFGVGSLCTLLLLHCCRCVCSRGRVTHRQKEYRDMSVQTAMWELGSASTLSTASNFSSPANSGVGSPARISRSRKGVFGGFNAA